MQNQIQKNGDFKKQLKDLFRLYPNVDITAKACKQTQASPYQYATKFQYRISLRLAETLISSYTECVICWMW